MNIEQKLTPKYWIAHNINSDDVYISTMFKYRQDTVDAISLIYGENWEENFPNIKIDLFEINMVK